MPQLCCLFIARLTAGYLLLCHATTLLCLFPFPSLPSCLVIIPLLLRREEVVSHVSQWASMLIPGTHAAAEASRKALIEGFVSNFNHFRSSRPVSPVASHRCSSPYVEALAAVLLYRNDTFPYLSSWVLERYMKAMGD